MVLDSVHLAVFCLGNFIILNLVCVKTGYEMTYPSKMS